MSETSDCEEFYDAEDITPNRNVKKRDSIPQSPVSIPGLEDPKSLPSEVKVPLPPPEPPQRLDSTSKIEDIKFSVAETNVETSPVEIFKVPLPTRKSADDLSEGRKWFRELRQQMLTDDEDLGTNPSPPDSQTSSVDGVFPNPPGKTSHPFRIIEHDGVSIHSMTSLGRVGRILSGSDLPGARETVVSATVASTGTGSSSETRDPSPGSAKSSVSHSTVATPISTLPFLEPDVIASTKNSQVAQKIVSNNIGNVAVEEAAASAPVAPPRRRKKKDTVSPKEANEVCIPLPSPASTIESLTREFEHSLDIKTVTKGQYVVKPQDEESAKAEGPPPNETETLERLKAEPVPVKEKIIKLPTPYNSNSIGRISINSANALSMSHFTGLGAYGESKGKLKVSPKGTHERRRSAGDEQAVSSQLNMFVRTRTDSGKQLTDLEILEQVTVLNLDTGERVPLSIAEDKLPQGINPLSLHIMRLTNEYVSNPSLQEKESDEESVDSKMTEVPPGGKESTQAVTKRRADRFKKFLGTTVKKTMHKAKSIAQEVSHSRHKDDMLDIADEGSPGETYIKLKASSSHKGPYDFDSLQMVQDLSGLHQGPIWCMKFSACGRLLATAGQDRVLRVWVLRSAYQHFQDMRTKYNAEKVSPTPSQESLASQQSAEEPPIDHCGAAAGPFMPRPFCTYSGHTSDLLDLSWSKNYFILSSSMDKTVRLWHIYRKECLCCFQHIDFVTAIVFHPRDDRYFLSGSLDGKLRLWDIPERKVAVWTEIGGQSKLITAANFCQNGKFAVIGSYDGRCIFYNTEQLKYHTTIHVRSSRGKNAVGRKISGVEPMPGEDKILVTSNDSRIRLYDLRDLNVSCKYKGYVNVSSQIKASFSHDGKYIVSGSENQCLYIWKTHHDYFKFSSVRRDRNDFWEGVKAHNAVVTCAVFAPHPEIVLQELEEQNKTESPAGYALVSADFNGCIKVFINRTKPKHSSLPASALA